MNMFPTPGPEHQWFARHTGIWDAKITTSLFPGAPPVEWKGEVQISVICNGLWELLDFKGEMSGHPFIGHGVTGFDFMNQHFVQVWVDSMSPAMLQLTGRLNAEKNCLTMFAEVDTPGGRVKMKQTTRETSAHELIFTIDMPGPGGAEHTMMRAVYARRR
ncbi:MAG: DUF1579 domain-containing protein [Planctomycetota bacterium]